MSTWNITVHEADGTTKNVALDMPEEFDEKVKEEEKLWCKCGTMDHPENKVEAKYVENYMGVDHGWICPNCGKFVQIG